MREQSYHLHRKDTCHTQLVADTAGVAFVLHDAKTLHAASYASTSIYSFSAGIVHESHSYAETH